jgi:hypothetical protein
MVNKKSESTPPYPKSFEKTYPPYEKGDYVLKLIEQLGDLPVSGSKEDTLKIYDLNEKIDAAIIEDKKKWEESKVVALTEAWKKAEKAEKKWEKIKKAYPNGKESNGVYTADEIKFYKPSLNYGDLAFEDAIYKFEVEGMKKPQEWQDQAEDGLEGFFDKVKKAKSSYDSKLEQTASDFKALQKNMPGGKLNGDVYTVEGNDFKSDGTLKAKNGNVGTWEDLGKKYMIYIGDDGYDHSNALEGLNKANEKYVTRRRKEIKNEKADAALDAITGVKGSGAAVRKKTEGNGRPGLFKDGLTSEEKEIAEQGMRRNSSGGILSNDFEMSEKEVSQAERRIKEQKSAQQSKGNMEKGLPTLEEFNVMPEAQKQSLADAMGMEISEYNKYLKLKKYAEISPSANKGSSSYSSSSSSSSRSSGGGYRVDEGGNEPININDLTDEVASGVSETTTGSVKKIESAEDIKRRIQDNKDLLNNLGNRPKFVHDYAPDEQKNTNLADSIVDAGRIGMGLAAANTKIPVYERGSMFQTSMDELAQRRNMGLSDAEKDFARNMAERGYGYDVKNIGKFAGGSAGVALGNLGRATGQLYDEYGKLAVRDEAVRRQNRSDFNRGALADEQVNRQIFQDDLTQKMMTKQAGAALVQDATKNMRERAQYERAYGKGSQFYEYMKTLDKDKKQSMFDQELANKDRVEESIKTTQRAIEDDEKLLQGLGGLTEGTTLGGEPTALEGVKTVAELQELKNSGEIDEATYNRRIAKSKKDAMASLGLTQEVIDSYDDNSKVNAYNKLSAVMNGTYEGDDVRKTIQDEKKSTDEEINEGLRGLGLNKEKFDALDDDGKKQVSERLASKGIYSGYEAGSALIDKAGSEEVVTPDVVTPDEVVTDVISDTEEKVSREDQTPEDKIADYEKEVSQDEETLKRYEEDPIAFLEEDIRGWESEPDSDKKTESLKNLRENLEYLKSGIVDKVTNEETPVVEETTDEGFDEILADIDIGKKEWEIRGYENEEAYLKDRNEAMDKMIASDNDITDEGKKEWEIRGYENEEAFEKEKNEAMDKNIESWNDITLQRPNESDEDYAIRSAKEKARQEGFDSSKARMYDVENSSLGETTRQNIGNALSSDFNTFQSVLEDEIGRVDENGKVVATPHSKEEMDAYDVDGDVDGAGEMSGGYGPKQGIKKLFPEMKDNEELFNSPQGEMLRMFNVNAGWNPKVVAALSQGLIEAKDRGAYHRGDKDINDIKGIDLNKVDPQTLLNEMADVYKNTYGFGEDSRSGKLPKQYNAYAERIVSLAKRHGLNVPKRLMEK